jgi:hypothetical protein
MLNALKRDRWIASLLLVGLLVLLVLVLRDYGVRLPRFPQPTRHSETAFIPVSDMQLDEMLAAASIPALRSTNFTSPFFTTHFQPPKPPAPTTRKVNMVYQGFFQSTDGDKQAFLRVDDANRTVALGRPVIADLAVSDIQTRTLTLTNSASRTNVLEFNKTVAVEVPVP